MQGDQPLPDRVIEKFAKTGGELCKDVFLLSECSTSEHYSRCIDVSADKSGIITTANGLRIACLGGVYDPSIYSSVETAPVSFSCTHAMLHADTMVSRASHRPISLPKQLNASSPTPSPKPLPKTKTTNPLQLYAMLHPPPSSSTFLSATSGLPLSHNSLPYPFPLSTLRR